MKTSPRWFNVDCSLAEGLYSLNDEIAAEAAAITGGGVGGGAGGAGGRGGGGGGGAGTGYNGGAPSSYGAPGR